jgi:hypothetical protein
VSRLRRSSGRRWCRCPLANRGCGFSISCRGPPRSTTWRWRCGCPATWMSMLWPPPWVTWWHATRAFEHCSWHRRAYPNKWWWPLIGPSLVGRSLIPVDGPRPDCTRRSTSPWVTRSIYPPQSPCGQRFSAALMTSMYWWAWCTTSPPTAGRSPHWCAIWARRMTPAAGDKPRAGRNCQCSTPTTPYGSARNSVTWTTPVAPSGAN